MSRFCFKLRFTDREICIPVLIKKISIKPEPDPGPWKRKYFEDLNEHFNEAIKNEIIKKDLVADVAILSAIKQLSTELSPEFAGGFQENIKKINSQINENLRDVSLKI